MESEVPFSNLDSGQLIRALNNGKEKRKKKAKIQNDDVERIEGTHLGLLKAETRMALDKAAECISAGN